jgi:hypothetical protein
VKTSIYVPLTVLYYDKDLLFTIKGLASKSSGTHKINIHISVVGLPEHAEGFDEMCKDIENIYPHVSVSYRLHKPIIKNIGVGPGRTLSMLGYKDEDYMLQIDPHTFFDDGWDIKFISFLDESIALTKNNKTIITCYLDRYFYDENGLPISNFEAAYCFFDIVPERRQAFSKFYGEIIPTWQLADKNKIRNGSDQKYFPSIKFNANCAFGNKEFARYTGLFEGSMFFEEEIIQTINLFENGFCLVYPATRVPASHLYHYDGTRDRRKSLGELINWDVYQEQTAENFISFLNNNRSAVEKYEKYINFDFYKSSRVDKSGEDHVPVVPEYFLNGR